MRRHWFPKRYADTVARLRVTAGFVMVAAFAWFSHPCALSLAIGLPLSACGLALRAWAAGHLRKDHAWRPRDPIHSRVIPFTWELWLPLWDLRPRPAVSASRSSLPLCSPSSTCRPSNWRSSTWRQSFPATPISRRAFRCCSRDGPHSSGRTVFPSRSTGRIASIRRFSAGRSGPRG